MELVPYEPDKGMEGKKPMPDGTVFIPLEELPSEVIPEENQTPPAQSQD